jgi:hypothetical protein
MSKAPKYSFRVVEKRNKTWTAEIQRQATSKKKVVSKRQSDFASEAEGTAWAEAELVTILANHIARNKRHDDDRAEQYQNKLKQAELAAATAALESSYDAEDSTEDSSDDSDDSEEDAVDTENNAEKQAEEQAKIAAELQEVAELASDDSAEPELADKPKFDFEVELEEAEAEEKVAKKKAKAAAKKAEVADASSADDSETADGSDEVNSIYLQK